MDSSSAAVEFTRAYLAVFYSLVAAFYTIRIVAMKRVEARGVIFPGEAFSFTWWNHLLFRVFRLAIWMVCLIRWFFPAADQYLGIFSALNIGPVLITGNIMLTLGFLLAILVHFSLGPEWRSGIDPSGPQNLRTEGFYRYSRHPMFLGVATAQIGFFLALPSVFSLACLFIGLNALRRQATAEETHLTEIFRPGYEQYMQRVRRWV